MKNKKIINYITKVAIFSAISIILYIWLKFPLPFFPPFLKIQFSNLPAILGGLALGPLGGVLIVVIRTLGNLAINGTDTFFVGETADLLIGVATVLTSSLIYKHYRTRKGGLFALILGCIVWMVTSVIINWLFILPTYIEVYFNGNVEGLVGMCQSVLPSMTVDNYMIIYLFGAALPFNALLSVIVSIVTFLVYKRISVIFKKDFFNFGEKHENNNN